MTASRLLLVLLLAVGIVLGGCGGSSEPSTEEFADAVVLNRNRADFALGRITRAQSVDELLARMDEAAVVISKAADELEDTGAPPEYQPEADDLVKSLRQLSVDIQATADQARVPGFEYLLTDAGLQGLSFESWDQTNKALAGLAGKGIEVTILQPKGGE
ncbi:MAG TPA: hypothetical protein VFU99_08450 [Gaiellaceae bacterium]|nr:hypothetical protein [Gaiellaceae bacterium]